MACRRHLCPLLVVATLASPLAGAGPLGAQEPPQEIALERKLVAGERAEGDNFGAALAVDGDFMAVAAPYADLDEGDEVDSSGVVYVFLRDQTTGAWVEHQQLVPEQGHYEGNFSEIALAIQGATIVVGAPYATLDRFQEGAVYVFERDEAGTWTEAARVTDAGIGFNGHFGVSLALEGDLLAIGATQESIDRHGRVGIFERNRGGEANWGRVTTLYGFNWGDPSSTPDDAGNPRAFGSSVALQGDLLLVGARSTTITPGNGDGAAYLFRRDATDPDRWQYLTRLVRPGADDCVGGLPLSHFYREATPEEIGAAAACAAESGLRAGNFGHRVALRDDTVVVGARFVAGDDGSYSVGKAYVYARDPGGADVWSHVATLAPSAPSSGGYFGSDLALEGDTVLVGAPGTEIEGRARQGAAYLFERGAGGPEGWGEVARLLAYDGLSESQFGAAVALEGAAGSIGARGDSTYRGAVYIHAPPPPDEPAGPAFEPTGELADGGVAEHAFGALLGAGLNTLPAPLPVWIHEVAAPAEPLPAEATAVGPFYNVGAARTTIATREGTFALALPVPEGTATTHLSVAALVAADRQLEGQQPEDLWLPITGAYDPDERLFSVALDALEDAGGTFVLMEHPDVEAMAPPPAAAAAVRTAAAAVEFEVRCYGFKDDAACSAADEEKFEGYLEEAYARFTAAGYEDPRLSNKTVTIRRSGDGRRRVEKTETLRYYGNKISDPLGKLCTKVEGFGSSDFYEVKRSGKSYLVFCVSAAPSTPDDLVPVTDDDRRKSAAHELFHAFQYGEPRMFEQALAGDGAEQEWVAEGTASAAAAEASTATALGRAWSSLRPITIGLTAHDIASALDGRAPTEGDDLIGFSIAEYLVEDFWVYYGLRENLGLGYFESLFERGGTTGDAVEFFRDRDTTLATEYWRWVKNQAMEKTVPFAEVPLNPCEIQADVIGDPPLLWHPLADRPNFVDGSLPRLTSAVIKITAVAELGPTTIVADEVEGLRYKVYLENEERSCAEVAAMADGERTFPALPFGTTMYVIVANTRYWDRLSYKVRVEPASS